MLALTRAVALNKIVDVFSNVGTPVARELQRANLPADIADHSTGYVSTVKGFEFVRRCKMLDSIPDLGWEAFKHLTTHDLNENFLQRVGLTSTLHERLRLLERSMPCESNYLTCRLEVGFRTSVFGFTDPHLDCANDYSLTEWFRVLQVVRVIQSAAGPDWRPDDIGFISRFAPGEAANQYFGGHRIRTGQAQTYVRFASAILPTPVRTFPVQAIPGPGGSGTGASGLSVTGYLHHVLKPYFSTSRPSIEVAASLAGMSKRSLQRTLRSEGMTYSRLLDQCAFEIARSLLKDRDIKIIDVALSIGYQDPTHFSRAFKRISGLSPTAYRFRIADGADTPIGMELQL